MRWITDAGEFDALLSHVINHAKYADCASEPNNMTKLTFDSVEFGARGFPEFLRKLLELGGDTACYYVVCDPDPVNYFFLHFRKFPALEISVTESGNDYFKALHEDPGNSPADAVGTNWYEYVIFPLSGTWFIHGVRKDTSGEGGDLWAPTIWTTKMREAYPYELYAE